MCHVFQRDKQRLAIAQGLLNEPKLLIADEPTSALDPQGRKEILTILEKAKEKTTVLFSTHILSDVESICDSIAILHEGKIAVSGNLHELLQMKELHRFMWKLSVRRSARCCWKHCENGALPYNRHIRMQCSCRIIWKHSSRF